MNLNQRHYLFRKVSDMVDAVSRPRSRLFKRGTKLYCVPVPASPERRKYRGFLLTRIYARRAK